MLLSGLNTLVRWCLSLVGMILVLFEEVLWIWFGSLLSQLSAFAPVAWLERKIRRLPPMLALPLFLLPWLIMLPVKLGALWLIAMGKVVKGVLLFVGGEAFGVAFLARLYDLCRPALHQWRWFVIVEGVLMRWTRWAHEILYGLPLVKATNARWQAWWSEIKRNWLLLHQRIRPPKL
jgi:hypothetical protein